MKSYPFERELVLTVPHGRGGSTDRSVRILTRGAEKHLGAGIHVQNLAGLNGTYALDLMVDSIRALPDGYSLSTANTSVILSPLVGHTKYRYTQEIRPLLMYAESPFLLAVPSDRPYADIDGLIRQARSAPRSIVCGNSGVGNVSHILMEMLCAFAGIRVIVRSYDSGRELTEAFAHGEVDCIVSNAVDLREQIRSGKARILATAAAQGDTVPCFHDLGYDLEAYLRQGIGVSVQVPTERFLFLQERFLRMARKEDVQAQIEAAGMAYRCVHGSEYELLWQEEEARWERLFQSQAGQTARNAIETYRGGHAS